MWNLGRFQDFRVAGAKRQLRDKCRERIKQQRGFVGEAPAKFGAKLGAKPKLEIIHLILSLKTLSYNYYFKNSLGSKRGRRPSVPPPP